MCVLFVFSVRRQQWMVSAVRQTLRKEEIQQSEIPVRVSDQDIGVL